MIDYIYLILILVLIGFILFIIYLSYEYRIKEGFGSLPQLSTNIDSKYAVTNLRNQGTKFNNHYIGTINDAIGSISSKDYNAQIELLQKSNNNSKSSQKIIDLQNQLINGVHPASFPIDKLISTIKSKYNSQYLSTFSNDSLNYGVLANDKCLTVNGLCKEDFCLLECQNNLYSSDTQKFKTKRIYSNADASKVMNVPINNISNTNIYPFNIFTSVINNNCLTIGDGGITVEKCNLNNIKQQWEISPDENICIFN